MLGQIQAVFPTTQPTVYMYNDRGSWDLVGVSGEVTPFYTSSCMGRLDICVTSVCNVCLTYINGHMALESTRHHIFFSGLVRGRACVVEGLKLE